MATLDIALLRSFVVVSRAGSIRAAAERVGRTQSAVSLQMKRLEEIVGERLFHRTGSGVTLTVAGERLMAGAERILSAHDETLASIRAQGLQGAISFGCPEDYLTAFFPDLLRRYGRDNPEVEVEIVCAPTVALRPMLQRRHIDLALVSVPASSPPEEIFRRESFAWIASSPEPELLTAPFLPVALSGPDTLDHKTAKSALEEAGLPYRITHASDGFAGLLAIARSGLAISVVARSAVPPDLFVVEKGLPGLPQIGMSIAYASSQPSPVVRAFGEFIAGSLSTSPPGAQGVAI